MKNFIAKSAERWNPESVFYATFQADAFTDAVTTASLIHADATLLRITSEGA